MSYFSQMAGLTVQNFLSAGVGIAVAVAVIRGIIGRSGQSIGNFWFDLIRTVLWVLTPIAFLVALILIFQGSIQTFSHYLNFNGPTGLANQIAMGPVASQEAIKELGTNGGGVFNTNSAHPFENPSGFTNLLEMLLVLVIPAALIFGLSSSFGGDLRASTVANRLLSRGFCDDFRVPEPARISRRGEHDAICPIAPGHACVVGRPPLRGTHSGTRAQHRGPGRRPSAHPANLPGDQPALAEEATERAGGLFCSKCPAHAEKRKNGCIEGRSEANRSLQGLGASEARARRRLTAPYGRVPASIIQTSRRGVHAA